MLINNLKYFIVDIQIDQLYLKELIDIKTREFLN